jgi:DNA primase
MDAVEDIKSRLSVEDVASEYMELKRAGRNLKGLSPFSNEKTASLMVSPEKQIWHDFSSGKGGDMFTLVMELEGVDFKGALDILARKAGVDLDQYRTEGSAQRSGEKNKLYDVLEAATRFYQVQFSQNKIALDYILKERGFTKDIALEFRLGYSPNTGRALLAFLKKKGFTEEIIKKAGLATARYSTANDMFRGRIMVPLQDATGRVIGFTARALDPNDTGPKYINTPQTPVYDKGRHAYGLHLAKDSIRKDKFVVVVEGNLDVIASRQASVDNVVATAGTAMTEMHLKELARFTQDVRLAFDQDQAGLNAMERIIPLASNVDIALSIITVPEGKDPDELIQKDPKLWQQAVGEYEYAIDWLIRRRAESLDMQSGSGKKALTDAVLPVVARLKDSVERDHYLRELATLLGVDKAALSTKLQAKQVAQPAKRFKKVEPEKVTKMDAESLKAQNQLLALCYVHPDLRSRLEDIYDIMFGNDQLKQAFKKLSTSRDPGEQLFDGDDYGKILAVQYDELYGGLEYIELEYEATRLQARVIERYVKSQKTLLATLLQDADEVEKTRLQSKDKQLNDLLKRTREKA